MDYVAGDLVVHQGSGLSYQDKMFLNWLKMVPVSGHGGTDGECAPVGVL